MSENKLQINRDLEKQGNEIASRSEIAHLEKNINGLNQNISDLESRREMELGELADEKNYDIIFYIAGAIVLLNLIFNFNIFGLILSFLFGAMFFVYKKYFRKEQRAERINSDIDQEISELNEKRREREEDISKIGKGSE